METLGQRKTWSFIDGSEKAKVASSFTVREGPGYRVESYLELAKKVAELQFRNIDHVLVFRGQPTDHKNTQNRTSLKPRLFRPEPNKRVSPKPKALAPGFALLRHAEKELTRLYTSEKLLGKERLNRYRILRWSILQHYEVCPTPLLDVTHSLRIAASFASRGAKGQAYVMVLAVPSLSGAITVCAEAGLQTIRLASVCPPCALRPHIQEGYLLGEYPDITAHEQNEHYKNYEIDFGRRLIAKFVFDPATFWKRDTFPRVPKAALYPNDDDPLHRLTREVKAIVNPNSTS